MKNNYKLVKNLRQLRHLAKVFHRQNKRIVLCHGVFDLVHWGHIIHFEDAKKDSDVLVVSLVNDKYIKKVDVKKRPLLFPEKVRINWLASLGVVDHVVLCQDIGPWKVMKALRPHLYVKGDDSKWRLKDPRSGLSKDKRVIESLGGKLKFVHSITHASEILEAFSKGLSLKLNEKKRKKPYKNNDDYV